MGERGRKYCSRCNYVNGPRAKNCKNCGFGFVIKGVKSPDLGAGPGVLYKDSQYLVYKKSPSEVDKLDEGVPNEPATS